jgi:hypothetical protein
MAKRSNRGAWILWAVLSVAVGGYLAAGLLAKSAPNNRFLATARSMLLPGQTTHGHHQIELVCEACHGNPFGGKAALQEACTRCHGAELKEADDKHPLSKFTDPRNADRLEKLDATLCVTCHVEHRPQITTTMGLTLPRDYCFYCHDDIAKDRPSHARLAFDTCSSSGCHRYHDNRALYEDFLAKRMDQPATLEKKVVRSRGYREVASELPNYPRERYPLKPLAKDAADAPAALMARKDAVEEWHATAHAAAGVNCSACHEVKQPNGAPAWVERPDQRACATCHASEVKGFLAGRHGMRLAAELTPMTPGRARLPMRPDAHDTALGCATCHGAHRFDTKGAAVEACLSCHRDHHSLAYEGSPHHVLWKKEIAGEAPAGTGVSCATCHMPRVRQEMHDLGLSRTLVQHNQNDTLRPNDKMVRPVCLNCHGLGFVFDSLADSPLIAKNFAGRPQAHVKSLEMVAERLRQRAEKRRSRAARDDE